jgi:hypothetical protein
MQGIRGAWQHHENPIALTHITTWPHTHTHTRGEGSGSHSDLANIHFTPHPLIHTTNEFGAFLRQLRTKCRESHIPSSVYAILG